jgi:PPOX class probable FMN-dependent enzyme
VHFDEVIETEAELRRVFPPVSERAAAKVIDRLDDICRRYIAASPFVLIATQGADGLMDISPKGDPVGFVRVLDDRTLAIPDRPGNNRLDTFSNILSHPQTGLIFLIPGNRETLRVSGRARLVRDAWLLKEMAVNGRQPLLALVIDVEEVFTHCPKCAIRSGLWQPESWPDLDDVPSLAEALQAHASVAGDVGALQQSIEASSKKTLY